MVYIIFHCSQTYLIQHPIIFSLDKLTEKLLRKSSKPFTTCYSILVAIWWFLQCILSLSFKAQSFSILQLEPLDHFLSQTPNLSSSSYPFSLSDHLQIDLFSPLSLCLSFCLSILVCVSVWVADSGKVDRGGWRCWWMSWITVRVITVKWWHCP